MLTLRISVTKIPNAIFRYIWCRRASAALAIPVEHKVHCTGDTDQAHVYDIRIHAMDTVPDSVLVVMYGACESTSQTGIITSDVYTRGTYRKCVYRLTNVTDTLAKAPFGWVEVLDSSIQYAPFVHGDDVPHRVRTVLTTIGGAYRRYMLTQGVSYSEDMVKMLTRQTLAILAAPLSMRVLLEQQRQASCVLLGSLDTFNGVPWGTNVVWDGMPSSAPRSIGNNSVTETDPVSVVIGHGLLRAISSRHTQEEAVSYNTVILAAYCTRALDCWKEYLNCDVSEGLYTEYLRQFPVCNRCGASCVIPPHAPNLLTGDCIPRSCIAVRQLDSIILGPLCTSLCSRVQHTIIDNDELERRRYGSCRNKPQFTQWCITHTRAYCESREGQYDKSDLAQTCRHGYTGAGESTWTPNLRTQALAQDNGGLDEPDPYWWLWQKRERLGRDYIPEPSSRLWNLFEAHSYRERQRGGETTASITYTSHWSGYTCGYRGRHIISVPLGWIKPFGSDG